MAYSQYVESRYTQGQRDCNTSRPIRYPRTLNLPFYFKFILVFERIVQPCNLRIGETEINNFPTTGFKIWINVASTMSDGYRRVWTPSVSTDDSIGYSEGLHFRIVQVFNNQQRKNATIIEDDRAAAEKVYPVLFDKNDIDFHIRIENKLQSNALCEINIGNTLYYSYMIKSGVSASLKALESNGKRLLHFVSQGTDNGRTMVEMSARESGTTYEQAAIDCSRIKIDVNLERRENEGRDELKRLGALTSNEPKIQVLIKQLNGSMFALNVCPEDPVELLKLRIEERTSEMEKTIIPDQQRLIYGGRQMSDGFSLEHYGVQNGSIIHLILRLRGGSERVTYILEDDQQCAEELSGRGGERGIVCFGDRTNQQCAALDRPIIVSEIYSLEGFTLELRTKPAFSTTP